MRQCQLDGQRVRLLPADRAWVAAPLHHLPRPALRNLRLLVQPDTILRWHRDLPDGASRESSSVSPPGIFAKIQLTL